MHKLTCLILFAALFLTSCAVPPPEAPQVSIPLETPQVSTPPQPETTITATEPSTAAPRPLRLKDPSELLHSRVGSLVSGTIQNDVSDWEGWVDNLKSDGFTQARFTINFSDGPAVNLSYAFVEDDLPDAYVNLFKQMKKSGIQTRYSLSFWDMAFRNNGGTIQQDRLSTQEETDRYLAYVKMVATRLKGQVDAYELWNEPDANYDFYQRIKPEDYIRVARLAIPIIKEMDPQAKIVLCATSSYIDKEVQDYSAAILQSDIIALADEISLHTVNNDSSPVFRGEYYAGYDAMWDDIKKMAESHGFRGEYYADELNYRSNYSLDALQPEIGNYHPYEPEIAAKYIGRMIAINLGQNISVGTSGTNAVERPKEGRMIRNLAYILDGTQAYDFPVEVTSKSTQVRYYTFTDTRGNLYLAIWDDGEAKVESDEFESTIVVKPSTSISSISAIDPFQSTEQKMSFTRNDNELILPDIPLKDYPLIIQLLK